MKKSLSVISLMTLLLSLVFLSCSTVDSDDTPVVETGAYRLIGSSSESSYKITLTTTMLGFSTDSVIEDSMPLEEEVFTDTTMILNATDDSVELYTNTGVATVKETFSNRESAIVDEFEQDYLDQLDSLIADMGLPLVRTKSSVAATSTVVGDTTFMIITGSLEAKGDTTISIITIAYNLVVNIESVQKFVDYDGPVPPTSWPAILP